MCEWALDTKENICFELEGRCSFPVFSAWMFGRRRKGLPRQPRENRTNWGSCLDLLTFPPLGNFVPWNRRSSREWKSNRKRKSNIKRNASFSILLLMPSRLEKKRGEEKLLAQKSFLTAPGVENGTSHLRWWWFWKLWSRRGEERSPISKIANVSSTISRKPLKVSVNLGVWKNFWRHFRKEKAVLVVVKRVADSRSLPKLQYTFFFLLIFKYGDELFCLWQVHKYLLPPYLFSFLWYLVAHFPSFPFRVCLLVSFQKDFRKDTESTLFCDRSIG